MEDLALGVDVEARALLLVEGAEGHEIGPRAFERHVRADHVHDVAGSADAFTGCGGEKTGHCLNGNPARPAGKDHPQ